MDTTEKEIIAEFLSLGVKIDDSHAIMCSTICKRNHISANDFVETWIAFSLSHLSGDMIPNMEHLLLMETKELTSSKANQLRSYSAKNVVELDVQPVIIKQKEETILQLEKMESESSAIKSGENKSCYIFPPQVVNVYGTEMKEMFDRVPLDIQPMIEPIVDKDTCMFSTIKDEANYVCDATFRIIDAIKENIHISEDDTEDNSSYYSGRILQTMSDSKLNPLSIKLHNPEVGDFSVDVSQLNDYSLFPGQVVIVKGVKIGAKIIASQIYDNGRLPLSSNRMSFAGKIQVLVAAGPLLDNNNNCESLKYLAKCTEFLQPQAIIFLGPIIDSKSFTSPGSVDFISLYKEALKYLSEQIDINTKIYCVVNKIDRCSIPVYPTLPPSNESNQRIVLLPDPALININGVVVGLSSTDILLHMAKHEIQKNCLEKFVRLSDHCIKQQTIYPLYPSDISVGIDYKLWEKYAMFSTSPHVMFFRSAFKYFVKESEGKTIIINPGSMSSRKDTKTFTLLDLYGANDDWNPTSSVSVKIYKA